MSQLVEALQVRYSELPTAVKWALLPVWAVLAIPLTLLGLVVLILFFISIKALYVDWADAYIAEEDSGADE